jgi:penicillin-binding protein 2
MNKSMIKRLRFFSIVVVLVITVLTSRLAWLQIYQYDYYFARAETNRMRELPIIAPRGEIFDRNGELLVSNRPGFVVSLLDLSKRDQPEVIRYLSELLEMEEVEIREKIWQQRFRSFAPIRLTMKPVSAGVVAQIEERRMDLPGVVVETQPIRYYVNDNLASHVLGYVGLITQPLLKQMTEQGHYYRIDDIIGIYGIESTWEQELRGQDGVLRVETNRFGRRTRVLSKEDPVPGNNLVLTLDARLQEIAAAKLSEVIEEAREKGNDQVGKGAVVALDPNNGEILAMVSLPDFNPNTFYEDFPQLRTDPSKPLVNRTIQGGYPVGSTFKMVGVVAGLQEKIITDRTIFTCTGRKYFLGESVSRGCYNGTVHGSLNVVQALAKSCNIFFFELGLRTGIDHLAKYAADLGFGKVTGLTDLSGEIAGIMDSRESRKELGLPWYPGDVLTVSIGQGNTMISPLQLANYGSMLANEGTHYRPHLVRQVENYQGEILWVSEPEALRQLEYDEKTWDTVHRGMEAVTLPGGTGSSLRNLPVLVAGKTGSAQAGGSGTLKKAHSLFVGYAPAEAPEIVLAIIVEHGGLGGDAAVPVANRIFQEYYTSEVTEE